jgi:hypothetical protein
MFQINPSQSHDWQRPTISPADPFHLDNQRHEVLDALDAYRRQARRGWFYRLWSRLRQRPYSLWNLSDVSRLVSVRSRYPAGLQLVPLSAIKGSEGKERDFDGRFHPLRHELSRQRWISIALVRNKGQSLAPVELIRVDDGRSPVYFVRDGHHRISVARSYGQREIEANVTVWQLSGPAPWTAAQPALQPLAEALAR